MALRLSKVNLEGVAEIHTHPLVALCEEEEISDEITIHCTRWPAIIVQYSGCAWRDRAYGAIDNFGRL